MNSMKTFLLYVVLVISGAVSMGVSLVGQAEEAAPVDKVERSAGGSEIYRHKKREREWEQPQHSAMHLEEVEAHLEKYIGKVESVFHEIQSDRIHLDVLVIPATDARPYHVLVTSGVSDEPMKVPAGLEKFSRAELLIVLPREWPLTQEALNDENNYWPVRWLKQIGRLPHMYETWIGWGHTIPNGDPPVKIANTGFVGVMLAPPYWLPEEFFQLKSKSGETVSFYQITPLYQEEMDLKLDKGTALLERRLEQENVGFVLNTQRPNVAIEKGWFR